MSFSKNMREIVHSKYDGHCAYCGCKITVKEMEIDHIIRNTILTKALLMSIMAETIRLTLTLLAEIVTDIKALCQSKNSETSSMN